MKGFSPRAGRSCWLLFLGLYWAPLAQPDSVASLAVGVTIVPAYPTGIEATARHFTGDATCKAARGHLARGTLPANTPDNNRSIHRWLARELAALDGSARAQLLAAAGDCSRQLGQAAVAGDAPPLVLMAASLPQSDYLFRHLQPYRAPVDDPAQPVALSRR